MEKTVALFDLPYQWIFPVIFVVMTAIIGICFMKYVILAENKDDDEADKEAQPKVEETAVTQVREKGEEKESQ